MTVDRAKLHKDIDDLTDEQFEDFLQLLRPFLQKQAQQGAVWAIELLKQMEQAQETASKPNNLANEIKS